MSIVRPLATLALAAVLGSTANASSIGMQRLELDFTSPSITRRVTWTSDVKLTIGKTGLVLDGEPNTSTSLSLQTTEPFAIGSTWRPARGARFVAHVGPPPAEVKLDNGQTYTPWHGQLYVRYSPDAKHWSTWQALHDDSTATQIEFTGDVEVPRAQAAAYDQLLAKYAKLDVPWQSDEEAAVKWIVKAQPDFFARELPFVGYVELLYETDLAAGQPLAHIDVDVSYAIAGLSAVPKDPKAAQNRDTAWRYRTK